MIKKLRYLFTLMLLLVASVSWGEDSWVKTDITELSSGDVVVITGTNASGTYAMTNNNGASSAPAVSAVTISDDKISSTVGTNIQWTIDVTANDYKFASGESFLYCTNTNNGVRVGSNSNNVFTISEEGYLVNSATSRYIGIYNSSDWRCYTSINDNIKNQNFAFYKKVTEGKKTANVSIEKTFLLTGTSTEVTTDGPTLTLTTSDASVASVSGTTITGVAEGNATITASWEENDEFEGGAIDFIVTVAVKHEGTQADPYTVAQARAAIDDDEGLNGVYASGIVSAIPTAYNSQYGNITFNIVDKDGDTNFLQAYRCVGDEAANVKVGDIVLVYGNLIKYGSTYEFAQGCELISLTHPAGAVEDPTFNPTAGVYSEAQDVTISCATSGAKIYYTLDGTDPTNASTEYTSPIAVSTTTTIKAIAYLGEKNSEIVSATYAFLEHAGTDDEPFTVAEAIAFINTLGTATSEDDVYVSGIISQVDNYNSKYSSITYWISDDGTTATQMEVYSGKGLNSADFSAKEDLQVGDEVTVCGKVKMFNGTPEFDKENYLVSFNRPVSTTVSLGTLTNVTIELWDGDMNDIEAGSEVTPGTLVYVKPTVATGYTLETLEVIDADDNVVELTENNGSWSFTMPNSSVTINATAKKEGGEQPAGEGEYVKVTSTEDLTDGEYLIVYEEGNLAFDGSLETLDAVGNTISVTISDDKIAATEATDAATFTIATIEGGYSIKSASGLYVGNTSDANALKTSSVEEYVNAITFDSNGNVNIVSASSYLRYNSASNQTRFRYYKSSSYTNQQAIQLYKKVTATPEPETVTVTITSAGYATFANKKAVDFSGTDVTVMTAKYDATTGKIDYTEVESKKVPAGAAVVLKGEADDYTANVIESADALQNNDLQVNLDEDILVNGTQYCLAKKDGVVGFYKVKAGDHVKAGKAYLVITDANAKDFYGFDDDATGIDGLNVNVNDNANEVFDLQGRRVARPTKGIYIVNGKKVVIK